MAHEHDITFGPFHLEMPHGGLWRGAQSIALRPRSRAMLRYLVEHPGRLVTKAELRQQVWTGTHVTDAVLRVSVREIRAALGDSAVAPRYLATVGRQGYRWLVGSDCELPPPLTAGPTVGRQDDVEALEGWFQRAAQGARQLVWVSGQAGVGKMTVVEVFLARLAAGSGVRVAWGQCVEHTGAGEPYLPVLAALGQLSRGPRQQEVLAALRRYAPMWLVQLPGLLPEPELERLQRQVQGATSARMLRELAEVLEVLTAETPLVLVLEDLHWSDRSTVDFLTYVAQRRAPARLLVLGTYRPVETLIRAHPLRGIVQEMCGRGQAVEQRLELLLAEDVAVYVAGRLGGPVATPLAAFIHARTEGNALFMVNILEHLVRQGLVVRREAQWTLRQGADAKVASLPEGLQQFLMRRIEDLPLEARQVLEVASVAGEAFAAAAVAASLQYPVNDVEAQCEQLLAQHHFIDDRGVTVWPDATRGGSYQFQHALYPQVLYEQVGMARRMHLHRRIGLRLEAGYGAQAGELAAQLAVHFERGGETARAVHYWQQAGDNAARHYAHHAATAALTNALALLATQPDTPERTQQELTLQLRLGAVVSAAKGLAAPDVGAIYTRAHGLCEQLGETPQRFEVLWGLMLFHTIQAQLPTADAWCQQLVHVAHAEGDAARVLRGHFALGRNAFAHGDLVAARAHLEQSLGLGDTPLLPTPTFLGGFEYRLMALSWLAHVLWGLGYADQAQQRSQEALTTAQDREHPPSVAYADVFAATLAQFRRDTAGTYARAEALMAFATAQGLTYRVEQGRILRGWALAMRGDAAGEVQIRHGRTAAEDAGLKLFQPYFLSVLAEACGQAGQPEAGLTALAEAATLVAATEERWWEAEVSRLQGTLRLQLSAPEVHQAEACFQQALAVAHRQQAKALELRAALSLSRLWQQQGQRDAARGLLAPIYAWFTEGFDTADLQEAKALLEEL